MTESHPVPELPKGLTAAVRELIHWSAHADTIGSLFNPRRICERHGAPWEEVRPYWFTFLIAFDASDQPYELFTPAPAQRAARIRLRDSARRVLEGRGSDADRRRVVAAVDRLTAANHPYPTEEES